VVANKWLNGTTEAVVRRTGNLIYSLVHFYSLVVFKFKLF